jgi:predicted nuclease of predicted toxin-antitoxin system
LPLRLYADECVHKAIVLKLREHGFHIEYLAEEKFGLSDAEIVKLISEDSGVLITEDSDFGEWVFVHGYKNIGVIFLRYKKDEVEIIADSIIKIIEKLNERLFKKFIVLTVNKIRIRELF